MSYLRAFILLCLVGCAGPQEPTTITVRGSVQFRAPQLVTPTYFLVHGHCVAEDHFGQLWARLCFSPNMPPSGPWSPAVIEPPVDLEGLLTWEQEASRWRPVPTGGWEEVTPLLPRPQTR